MAKSRNSIAELRDFNAELRDFNAELRDFNAELRDFNAESRDLIYWSCDFHADAPITVAQNLWEYNVALQQAELLDQTRQQAKELVHALFAANPSPDDSE